jgi:hypothetical protein
MLGEHVYATSAGANAVYRVVDEQIHMITSAQLVRMARLVELLWGVRGQCEAGTVLVVARQRTDSEPRGTLVRDHQ